MTVKLTAFQTSAFQHNAFQEADSAGSGGWRPFWTSMQMARRRALLREREEEEREEPVEVVEPEMVAMALSPIMVPARQVEFIKLIRASTAHEVYKREAMDLAEFEELLGMIEMEEA